MTTCIERVFNTQQWILVSVFKLSRLPIVLSEIWTAITDPNACTQVVELAAVQLQEANEVMASVAVIFINVHLSHAPDNILFHHAHTQIHTSNVTSRHRGPKRKRSWRVLLLHYYVAVLSIAQSRCCECYIFHRHMWYRALSLRDLCIRHSSSPRLPLCQFHFFRNLHCWAIPRKKIVYSITHSLTQLIWYPENEALALRTLHYGMV